MKKSLLPLLGLTLLTACHVGTYKKEICNEKNAVEFLNIEGEYKRVYKESERVAEIVKGNNGKGSYILREFLRRDSTTVGNTREVITCKVGDKVIVEFRDHGQRIWFDTDIITFAFVEVKDNEFILKGINRKDMGIPSINNTNMTAEETVSHFMPKDEYYKVVFKAAEAATTPARAKRPKILISE